MRSSAKKGFTLIELMIVVAVIAILAAIAYPSYTRYVYRARRADGQDLLMRIAAAQERYYTNFNKYTADITGSAPGGLAMNSTSSSGYYRVLPADVVASATGYTILARPQGAQTGDTACPTLSVDNALNKAPAGLTANGSCW
ncbi:MAG: prepilin-type N-terminal cleavage/methylation domain-containing protein [Rudaea sp.]|uniref:type IV pilin protein n=1 Tax=unclassified Rudaea TaxID=2627037 RepID=UPI0010F802B9|nr:MULTISPECIES: type IV pilin protein [unclassified Rudaea]MBN8886567.1 prepilin-type N-terminal cleavage/methylation domain-containing protein [Rudaea sp.]MBR0343896.1 prepilin-type N-terminal cleavage/methylation domain-containing protein [Rudaea sp.]